MKASKMRVVMILMALVPGLLIAQQDRGTIRGTVDDPSGAVIGGAVVTAVNVATGVRTTASSTADGNYNVPNLQAGLYRVEVEAASFKKLIRDNVRVNAGIVVALDLRLAIGETSDSVTVTAEAPQLEKESSDIRTTINPQTFADLPLVSGTGRNPTTFALLSPGTRQGGNSAAGSFYTPFNGGQILSGEVELDGLSVVFPPSPGQPDAIVCPRKVLHRHPPAGEVDHPGAEGLVASRPAASRGAGPAGPRSRSGLGAVQRRGRR